MCALSVFGPDYGLQTRIYELSKLNTGYPCRLSKKWVVMLKKIVLLENGSVREEGTFDELLKRDSLFSEFVHRQSLL